MENEVIEKYKKAGVIAKKAVALAREIFKPGASILEITNKVEELMFKEGAAPAFPLNVSINENAAHFTPNMDCALLLKDTDLVKVDVGVHVDGYIADTAVTLSMSKDPEHLKLIGAAEKGLKAGLDTIKPGVTLGEIGTAIDSAISSCGFKPISNLTGHGLDQYSLHAGLTIPNIKNESKVKLEEGTAVAIEPFSTNGAGMVADTNEVNIYEFLQEKPTRNRDARKLLQMSQEKFARLPFPKRWVEKELGKLKAGMALRELLQSRSLYNYPVLREVEKGLVAQAEHTVIVLDTPIITTI